MWGRRSSFVACLAPSGWQAMENDGLPHDGSIQCAQLAHVFHDKP